MARTQQLAAYAAGLFEGEGSIAIVRQKTRSGGTQWDLMAAIHMGDPEPMQALQERWEGRIYAAPDARERRRPMYRWQIRSRKAAAFLGDIAPLLLSARVRTKAELAIQFQSEKQQGAWREQDYLDRQHDFWDAMRRLNLRGSSSLTTEERMAILHVLIG